MKKEVSSRMVMNGAIITPELLEVLKDMQDNPNIFIEIFDRLIMEKIMSLDIESAEQKDIEMLQNIAGIRDYMSILTSPE